MRPRTPGCNVRTYWKFYYTGGLLDAVIRREFVATKVRREAEMMQLIEAALAHAKHLRDGANATDDYGARATIEEAQRWERLAHDAQKEASILLQAGK
jgi:hypothetical protein